MISVENDRLIRINASRDIFSHDTCISIKEVQDITMMTFEKREYLVTKGGFTLHSDSVYPGKSGPVGQVARQPGQVVCLLFSPPAALQLPGVPPTPGSSGSAGA